MSRDVETMDPGDYELLYEITEGKRRATKDRLLTFVLFPEPPADYTGDAPPVAALEVRLVMNRGSGLPMGFASPQDRANALEWWRASERD